MANLGRVFDQAVEEYQRGRPEYPQEAILFLAKVLKITPGTTVVDLAAGTGKFTKGLLTTGAKVIAVEPSPEMGRKLKEILPSTEVKEGSAEKIPLPDQSVDVVTVANAFHWFETEPALKEIHRVLRPGGKLGLIWGIKDGTTSWMKELFQLIEYEKGAIPQYMAGEWVKTVDATGLFTPLQKKVFPFVQQAPVGVMLDGVASLSYIVAMTKKERELLLAKVKRFLLNHFRADEKTELTMPYHADIYWAERL
ncbi:MAG: class I SAM-dependent methyltransferase [Deltaproteobacteria bacterium]|nr:class I SAM-dependent methyltransferase [Deltaproteobacteria bacterium]